MLINVPDDFLDELDQRMEDIDTAYTDENRTDWFDVDDDCRYTLDWAYGVLMDARDATNGHEETI